MATEKNTWQVEKKINLGDILTIAGMMSAVLLFVGAGWLYLHEENVQQDRRILLNETQITNLRREQENYQSLIVGRFDRIENILEKLNDKLDKKADK